MWNKTYDGWIAHDIIRTQDQSGNLTGYMACGSSSIYKQDPNKGRPALLQLNQHGQVVNTRTYELNPNLGFRAYAVTQTFSGTNPVGYAFIASKSHPGSYEIGGAQSKLVHVDNNLNTTWEVTLRKPGTKCALTDFTMDSFGNFYLVGHSNINASRRFDVWVCMVSSTGVLLWSRTYGSTKDEFGYDIVADPNGGFAITGSYNGSAKECLLLHIDASGNQDWIKHYGNTDNKPYSVGFGIANTNFGYAITGTAEHGGGNYPFLVLTDFNGDYLNGYIYDYASGEHNGIGVEVYPRLFSNGQYRYYISGTMDGEAMTLVTTGPAISAWHTAQNPTYTQAGFDPIYTNSINGASRTADGGFIMAGHALDRIWVVKVGLEGDPGCLVGSLPVPNVSALNDPLVQSSITMPDDDGPLQINNNAIPLPWDSQEHVHCYEVGPNMKSAAELDEALPFEGLSVYPNPNMGRFTVALDASADAQSVQFFNLAGQRVGQLDLKPGEALQMDFSALPQGLYIARSSKGEVVKIQVR